MYFVQLLLLIVIKPRKVDFFLPSEKSLTILYSGLNAVKLNDTVHYENKVHKTSPKI